MIKLFAKMNPFHRAVARFLITGGVGVGGGEHIASAKCTNLVGESVSSTVKMANNCKSLQSKQLRLLNENKSILRLDLSGSTVPGGGGATAPLPPSPASCGSVSSGFPVYPHILEISLHSIVMHFKRRHLQSTNYHR